MPRPSMETTAYFARVLKGDEGVALGLIADILQNSAFGRPELEGERQVILQEIAATRDSPDDIGYDLLARRRVSQPTRGAADSRHAGQRRQLHGRRSEAIPRAPLWPWKHGDFRRRRCPPRKRRPPR